MKKSLFAMLLAALLLCGCTGPTSQNEAEVTAPPAPEWTVDQLRDALRPWLEQDLSLSYFTSFFPKRGYGIVETIEQTSAADESFTFDYQVHYWAHVGGLDHEDSARYHYAREDGKMVCNVLFDKEDFQHFVLTETEETELEAARQQLIGVDALLPDYAEDLQYSDVEGEADQISFHYTLPLEKVLRENNKPSQMLNNILVLAGRDAYPDSGLHIDAELVAQRETLRPVSVRFDFSELEPILATLPDSREGEVMGPRMEMEFHFDYQLAETIPLPEYLLEAEEAAAAPTEESASLPQPGVIKGGEYRQAFFGLGFPLESWDEPFARDEIGMQYFGVPNYGSATMEELLNQHIPYVDVVLSRGNTTIQIMLEQTPLTQMDGSVSRTPAEYMDNNSRTIPASYESMGFQNVTVERFQKELCGRSFEGCRFIVEDGLYQTMLATEQDGVIYTIYVTCLGPDESETVLAEFHPLQEG